MSTRHAQGWKLVCVAVALLCAPALADEALDERVAEADHVLDRCAAELTLLKVRGYEKVEELAEPYREGEAAIEAGLKWMDRQLLNLPKPRGNALRELHESKKLELRSAMARLMYRRAELIRLTIAAMDRGDENFEKLLQRGQDAASELRVAYRDLVLGQMGHIASARLWRTVGEPEKAIAAIEPLIESTRDADSPKSRAMYRLAVIDKLESALALHDAEVASTCRALAGAEPFVKDAGALAQLAWVEARGLLDAEAHGDAVAQSLDAALALLRREDVVAAAPRFDRLQVIVDADSTYGGGLASADELFGFADLLIAAERYAQALKLYDRGVAMTDKPAPQRLQAHAALLTRAGRYADAAEAYDRLLELTDDEAQRANVMRWRNAALASAAQSDDAGSRALVAKQLEALLETADSDIDPETRRAALRRWAALRSERTGPAEYYPQLQQREALIGDDAYLLFALLSGRYAELTAEPDAPTREALLAVAERLSAVAESARRQGLADLAARAVLLRSRALVTPPLDKRLVAFEALQKHWSDLIGNTATRERAVVQRLNLLLDLGMVDSANDAVDNLPEGVTVSPGVCLRLAEALAERYDATDPRAGLIQQMVVRQANRAIASAAAEPRGYAGVALRGAEAMIKARAYTDARGIVANLIEAGELSMTGAQRLEAKLLYARVLAGQGDHAGALQWLEQQTEADHAHPAVTLQRGDILVALGRTGEALDAYRAARAAADKGGTLWWRATVALVDTLIANDNRAQAQRVLRVARALYPLPAGSPLGADVRRLQETLKATDKQPNHAQPREGGATP